MAMAEENTLKVHLKRFPSEVREELNEIVHRKYWRTLSREFCVETYTGVQPEALDNIPNLIDSSYKDLEEDVRVRMEILKKMDEGDDQSFKGKSEVGFNSHFYRYT